MQTYFLSLILVDGSINSMPAIDLSRLKIQAARLAEFFSDPPGFITALNELLEYYTNWTMRRSQVVQRINISTHHTPSPVLRQVELELSPLAESLPKDAVALTIALWLEGSIETRLLAGRLLGSIPLPEAVPALARLPEWLSQSTDKEIRAVLLTDALKRLRKDKPEAFFNLLEVWLKSPRTNHQIWGLRAIIPLLDESGFENLPAVFRILAPAIAMAGPSTQLDLRACLQALERVSVSETQMYLKEILSQQPEPMLVRTIRRILPSLCSEIQTGLREILRVQG